MNNKERFEILQAAYIKACKWIRQNPPSSLDTTFEKTNADDYVSAFLAAGIDPEGKIWQNLFIQEAIREKSKDA